MVYTYEGILNDINRNLSKMCGQQKYLEQQISQNVSHISSGKNTGKNKQNKTIDILEQRKKEVLSYYEIVKENSRKRIHNGQYAPIAPDMAKVGALMSKINLRNYNDPVADQVVSLCGSYLAYLDMQISQCYKQRESDIQALRNRENQKVRQLKNEQQQLYQKGIHYLRNDERVVALKESLDAVSAQLTKDGNAFRNYVPSTCRDISIPFGYFKYPLQIPSGLESELKKAFSGHIEKNQVMYPAGLSMRTGSKVRITYFPIQENEVESGIQAMIQGLLLKYPLREVRVTVFDTIHWNAQFLGSFTALAQLGEKSGFFPPAANVDDMKKKSASMMAAYQKFECMAGMVSLPDYNANPANKKKYPRRLILFVRDANSPGYLGQQQELSYLANNAEKLGILFIECIRFNGDLRQVENISLLSRAADVHYITANRKGEFRYQFNQTSCGFKWIKGPSQLPKSFIDYVRTFANPPKVGNEYFKRYPMKVPTPSVGRRKPIRIPFAVDEHDQAVFCSFENEMFAAFLMGASGSGKSTLLHTMIAGLVMNYHPDELELWMLDLKRTEFKKYETNRPPHVKYLLLMNSVDLICDFIDELCSELEKRISYFTEKGISDHRELPLSVHMPVIFVIIDEFAEVSDLLDDTYKARLEHLLRTGRSNGFKFLFASQRYSDGAKGLTSQAKAQIQMRFAMKGDRNEILETLGLSMSQVSEDLRKDIDHIDVYQTIFKRNRNGVEMPVYSRVRNMYFTDEERTVMIQKINQSLKCSDRDTQRSGYMNSYKKKNPVLLTSDMPLTFNSLKKEYDGFEAKPGAGYEDYVPEEDILIYAGVPESFRRAKPIVLYRQARQNMMVVGANADQEMNIWLSVLRSWQRKRLPMGEIEIWGHPQSSVFRRHRHKLPKQDENVLVQVLTSTEEIYDSMEQLEARKQRGYSQTPKLILIFGLEYWQEDFEDFDQMIKERPDEVFRQYSARDNLEGRSLDELNAMAFRLSVEDFQKWRIEHGYTKEIIERLNKAEAKTAPKWLQNRGGVHLSGMDRLKALLKDGPRKGCFFGVGMQHVEDLRSMGIKEQFIHKFVYKMTSDQSFDVIGRSDAAKLEEKTFLCISGYRSFRMRNHIHSNIPCNGYIMNQGKLTRN